MNTDQNNSVKVEGKKQSIVRYAQNNQSMTKYYNETSLDTLLQIKPLKDNSLNIENEGARTWNWKNSRCLKLYCECFKAGAYCERTCNWIHCENNIENEEKRTAAISSTIERNPQAFRPKISASHTIPQSQSSQGAPLINQIDQSSSRHFKGWACK